MNKQIQDFARQFLKEGLAQLPESNHRFFKRMYSFENLNADINTVIDQMPEDQLDWAMQQVQSTLDKKESNASSKI